MKVFAILAVWGLSLAANADFKGYVELQSGHEVYVNYLEPEAGRPTVVLVNGLVYDLSRWDDYVAELRKNGTGVVRYYFRGQLKTLLREVRKKKTPEFFKDGMTYQDLSKELGEVLDALEIRKKVTVVGLSYGASIAAEFAQSQPERVSDLVLMAPLVISLDHYDPAGAWIRWNLEMIRAWWGPVWGPAAYDYYYNLIYRHYLSHLQITEDRIPSEMKEIPEVYKESVFHQVRAVRDFDLRDYNFSKGPTVHLLLASEEDAPVFEDQIEAWTSWKKSSRGSLVYLFETSHAIPDSSPVGSADLTLKVLAGSQRLQSGRVYTLAPDGELNELKSARDLP